MRSPLVLLSKPHLLFDLCRLAKEEGWRARSAFKLMQINEEFNIFKVAASYIDSYTLMWWLMIGWLIVWLTIYSKFCCLLFQFQANVCKQDYRAVKQNNSNSRFIEDLNDLNNQHRHLKFQVKTPIQNTIQYLTNYYEWEMLLICYTKVAYRIPRTRALQRQVFDRLSLKK